MQITYGAGKRYKKIIELVEIKRGRPCHPRPIRQTIAALIFLDNLKDSCDCRSLLLQSEREVR